MPAQENQNRKNKIENENQLSLCSSLVCTYICFKKQRMMCLNNLGNCERLKIQ